MKTRVTAFEAILSPLEKDILNVLWPDKKLRVRQIFDKLKGQRKLALSSVAVLLDRLHNKKIVSRKVETARGGVRYIYCPTKNKDQFEQYIVKTTLDKLIDTYGHIAVSYFNERFANKKRKK